MGSAEFVSVDEVDAGAKRTPDCWPPEGRGLTRGDLRPASMRSVGTDGLHVVVRGALTAGLQRLTGAMYACREINPLNLLKQARSFSRLAACATRGHPQA
jgi:hypothetical protein